jgi:hypothetical protein
LPQGGSSVTRSPFTVFEISLRPLWRIVLALAIVVALSIALGGPVLRTGIAETLGSSGSVSDLQRALTIDPGNAELHRRLGVFDMYLADPPDSTAALAHLHRAVELDLESPLYWSNLGSACESAGDRACADAAFARLLTLAPMTPRYLWAAANYQLRSGNTDAALAQFRQLIAVSSALDPNTGRQYVEQTLEICLRALGDPETIFQQVLAGQQRLDAKLGFVDYLSRHDRFDDAYKVWVQTASNSGPFPFTEVQDYLARLLIQGRYQEAWGVWKDLVRLGVVPRPPGDEPDNLVFNGSFEAPPLNAGFDWHFADVPFLSLDLGASQAYHGARCLRLDFAKRNEVYQPVYQFVPVTPKQPYVLTAYVRSDGITSDTGPELRVFDPAHPENLDVSTETTVGTTAWHPVSLTFRPGPDTHFVMLAVRRSRSRSFPTEISGTFWVDAISIKPAGSATTASKQ